MEEIQYLIDSYSDILVITNFAVILILLIIVIIQGVKISSINSKYKKAFKVSGNENIEDVLINYNKEIAKLKETNVEIIKDLNRQQIGLNKSYSKSALHNYDALNDRAGKLSFVYVLLDFYNSGILINGIYNNAGHYLYLKNIENGKYEKELTKEENEALVKAMNNKE